MRKKKFLCMLSLVLSVVMLMFSLLTGIPAYATEVIHDSLSFTEEELEYQEHYRKEYVEHFLAPDETIEFGVVYRLFKTYRTYFLKQNFVEGKSIQEFLNSIEIERDYTYEIVHCVKINDTWYSDGFSTFDPSPQLILGEFLMFSVEESILQKNPNVNLDTLELQEVYCIDGTLGKDGLLCFLFTNQGNYVYYLEHIYFNDFFPPKSYFFTEEEFYEFIPVEYEQILEKYRVQKQGTSSATKKDTSDLISESPMDESEGFDSRHLFWMIPTGVAVLAAGVGLGVWVVRKKRKRMEE